MHCPGPLGKPTTMLLAGDGGADFLHHHSTVERLVLVPTHQNPRLRLANNLATACDGDFFMFFKHELRGPTSKHTRHITRKHSQKKKRRKVERGSFLAVSLGRVFGGGGGGGAHLLLFPRGGGVEGGGDRFVAAAGYSCGLRISLA